MTELDVLTFCGDCKSRLDTSEDTPRLRRPCSKCGSTKRCHDFAAHIEAGSAGIGMGIKAKHFGQKKPHVELKFGPSHSFKLDKPVEHERLIDRANDRYFEKVTNYETDELIHYVDESLSDHQEHGSAKKKNRDS